MPPKPRKFSFSSIGSATFSVGSRVSRKTYIDEGDVVTYITVPPDGGWGWVVVAVAMYANMLVDGSMMCYDLFKNDIQHTLGCSSTEILLPNSIVTGVYLLSGKNVYI